MRYNHVVTSSARVSINTYKLQTICLQSVAMLGILINEFQAFYQTGAAPGHSEDGGPVQKFRLFSTFFQKVMKSSRGLTSFWADKR